jgi:hypothetical protein
MVIRGGECKTICIMIVGAIMLLKTGINYVIAKLCIKQGSVRVLECIVVERNPNEDFSYYMDYFFFCFFGWFGIAPLMKIVKDDLGLTKAQIGNVMIASVSATILLD